MLKEKDTKMYNLWCDIWGYETQRKKIWLIKGENTWHERKGGGNWNNKLSLDASIMD